MGKHVFKKIQLQICVRDVTLSAQLRCDLGAKKSVKTAMYE